MLLAYTQKQSLYAIRSDKIGILDRQNLTNYYTSKVN